MKKLFVLVICSVLLFSCTERGEIVREPRDVFQYNGKIYQTFLIGIGDENTMWIVLPKDSVSNENPIGIKNNYNEKSITIIK